jgi:transketolase
LIPPDVLEFFRRALAEGAAAEKKWKDLLDAYRAAHPSVAAELERRLRGELADGWTAILPTFPADAKGMATRVASGKVLGALASKLPELVGGSADLTPSNNTKFEGAADFQPGTPAGRYLHFGVREHAMAAALNGMAVYGGLIPYGGTFLVFSDYMRPAIRIAAISHIPSIFVFTHDSVGLGEDGPTHQPVEHLAALRAIPGLTVIRPADANEVAQAWKIAITRRDGPTALALTRQSLPVFDRSIVASADGLSKGAYTLASFGAAAADMLLMASGSEVDLVYQAGQKLFADGFSVRVVSFPSWSLFEAQTQAYRDSVLPPHILIRLAVEAAVSQGWDRYVGPQGRVIGIDHYGASAPYKTIMDHFGFTVDNVYAQARALLQSVAVKASESR